MFGLIAGAIGTGLGLLQGRKKDKQAKQASDQSLAMQQQQLDFANNRYEDANKLYSPIEQGLLSRAMQDYKPRYQEVTTNAIGDVNTQFANTEDARIRAMQRMGVNPNSGRADSLARQFSLSKGAALAGAINTSRTTERNRADTVGWERLYNTMTLGANKMNGVNSQLTSAQNSMIDTQANRAANLQNQSSGMYGAAGQLAGSVLASQENQQTLKDLGTKAGGWLSGMGAR